MALISSNDYGFGDIPGLTGPKEGYAGKTVEAITTNLISKGGQGPMDTVWHFLGGTGNADPVSLSQAIKAAYAKAGNVKVRLNQLYAPGTALNILNPGDNGASAAAAAAREAAAQARADRINALHDNSFASLQQNLSVWGLEALTPWVHDQVFSSENNINTAIIQNIRNTAEYKNRFSGLEKLKQNQPGATENTYMQLEDNIRGALNGVDMPPNWLSQQQVGTLIGNGMYGANLTDRINKGLEVIQHASAQTKQMLNEYYGVDTGNLLGYVLDPNNNNYKEQIQASQAGGAALQTGFKGETKAMSEMLASSMPASTTSPQEFTAGFSKAAMLQPLEQTMAGQRGQATASSDQLAVNSFAQLGNMFHTDQGQVAATIKLAEQARVAGLSGGGGYVQDAGGGVGVGRTSTAGTGK